MYMFLNDPKNSFAAPSPLLEPMGRLVVPSVLDHDELSCNNKCFLIEVSTPVTSPTTPACHLNLVLIGETYKILFEVISITDTLTTAHRWIAIF